MVKIQIQVFATFFSKHLLWVLAFPLRVREINAEDSGNPPPGAPIDYLTPQFRLLVRLLFFFFLHLRSAFNGSGDSGGAAIGLHPFRCIGVK